jgi:hypothetical protein
MADAEKSAKDVVQNKANELNQVAKGEVDKAVNAAFFTSDPYKADTRRNRQRFSEYFDTLDVPDARDVYCYTDFVGIDYTVMFSFTCDTSSLGRIVRAKGLTRAPDELGGLGLQGSWDFDWWKNTDFKVRPPFHRGDGDKDRIYLWYDPISHRVTYQQFSL